MDIIAELKEEHREIERELIELETIMEEDVINRANLVHTFKNLIKFWNSHEEKEELLFPVLEKTKENIRIPVGKMLLEHKELRPHKEAMISAIDSGSEYEIKNALEKNARVIILKLRAHIDFEDEILYTSASVEFGPDELENLWAEMLNGK